MLALLTALVALVCSVACARRLAIAIAPTSLDPKLLEDAVRGEAGRARWPMLRDAIAAREDLGWERALFLALTESDGDARMARVNEQLTELDWRAKRWEGAPRVCARVSANVGFIVAAVWFAWVTVAGNAAEQQAAMDLVGPPLGAVILGLAGTLFCISVHFRARRAVAERLAATDRLVERLEALARG